MVCDTDGVIRELLHEDMGLGTAFSPGNRLSAIVDAGSTVKADHFLAALRERRAAFDWVLNVPSGPGVTPLHFSGCAEANGFFVVGTVSTADTHRLFEDLARINNEQGSALRSALKDLALQARERSGQDVGLYDELSRLNNELVSLQRELAKKNSELQRLNEQKNYFLGMAAHDLRSPLSAILNYTRFLQEEAAPVLSDEHAQFLGVIRSSTQYMVRLIDDLLDLAKIESGRLQLDLRRRDAVSLVSQNVELNRVLAERKGIAVRWQPPSDPLDLVLDAVKIEQVLNNLIGNAVKYSPRGSTVDVSLREHEAGILLAVEDEGPGIPEEKRSRLFQPFTRLESNVTPDEKSTGLGLAIVRKIIEAHGGWVRLAAGRSVGTRFEVWLPREASVSE